MTEPGGWGKRPAGEKQQGQGGSGACPPPCLLRVGPGPGGRAGGQLDRAPPAVFVFHKCALSRGGEAKFVSHCQRPVSPGTGRGPTASRLRATGGPRPRPPHQALQDPVLPQEVPGADPASPGLTHPTPPHPTWPGLPSTPVATWPGPQAGGAGTDGRCPGSLRRETLGAVPAAPHKVRAAPVLGVVGTAEAPQHRGPREAGPRASCWNSAGEERSFQRVCLPLCPCLLAA